MGRYLSFVSVFFLLLIVSCQKEKSFELGKPSRGSLQSSSGECLPKSIGGVYTEGQALADSNYLEVTVDVAQAGSYTIFTDTVNGYYFKATGKFSATGPATVRLKGFGTPGSAGTDDFAVFYDSSLCIVSIPVLPAGGSGGTAVFTLQGSGGNCINFTPLGTYTQGIALTSSNKVNIEVNVTQVGTWIMSTGNVTGFSFNGSGTFTSTGVQTITLDGIGTPTTAGTQTFNVTAGTSSCSFTITVEAGNAPPLSGDYFPLTQNSFWTYDGAGSDTLKTTVSGTATKGGKTYQQFVTVYESGPPNDTSYFRKDNATGFYYTYIDTSLISYPGLTFSQPALDMLFLKNALNTNDTWNSDFSADLGGVPVTVRFKYTCINANASLTANGANYTNVYHLRLVMQIGAAGIFQDFSTQDFYYAKGVGLVKISDQLLGDQVIRYWQVF